MALKPKIPRLQTYKIRQSSSSLDQNSNRLLQIENNESLWEEQVSQTSSKTSRAFSSSLQSLKSSQNPQYLQQVQYQNFENFRHNFSVGVRVRSLTDKEVLKGEKEIWGCDSQANIGIYNQRHEFFPKYAYDHVFQQDSTNSLVYQQIASDIVQQAVEGYNGTIFAYGVTGSGKTHTIMGNREDAGILPQAITNIFETTNEIKRINRSAVFLIKLSIMEIYNEQLRDLLETSEKNIKIREKPFQGFYMENLKEEIIVDSSHALNIINQAENERKVSATLTNDNSSRSHIICRISIENTQSDQEGNVVRKFSNLNIIDLAGSESAKAAITKTNVQEGSYINRSLLTLGTVIAKLSDGHAFHIPFRDSKLTKLLQNSLSGQGARVAIICNITPASSQAEETHNTLKFATRAKRIKVVVTKNEILNEKSLIKQYQKQIEELRAQVAQLRNEKQISNLENSNIDSQNFGVSNEVTSRQQNDTPFSKFRNNFQNSCIQNNQNITDISKRLRKSISMSCILELNHCHPTLFGQQLGTQRKSRDLFNNQSLSYYKQHQSDTQVRDKLNIFLRPPLALDQQSLREFKSSQECNSLKKKIQYQQSDQYSSRATSFTSETHFDPFSNQNQSNSFTQQNKDNDLTQLQGNQSMSGQNQSITQSSNIQNYKNQHHQQWSRGTSVSIPNQNLSDASSTNTPRESKLVFQDIQKLQANSRNSSVSKSTKSLIPNLQSLLNAQIKQDSTPNQIQVSGPQKQQDQKLVNLYITCQHFCEQCTKNEKIQEQQRENDTTYLKQEIKNLQENCHTLNGEIQQKDIQISDHVKNFKESNQQCEILQAQNRIQEQQIKLLMDNKISMEQEINQLKSNLKSYQEEERQQQQSYRQAIQQNALAKITQFKSQIHKERYQDQVLNKAESKQVNNQQDTSKGNELQNDITQNQNAANKNKEKLFNLDLQIPSKEVSKQNQNNTSQLQYSELQQQNRQVNSQTQQIQNSPRLISQNIQNQITNKDIYDVQQLNQNIASDGKFIQKNPTVDQKNINKQIQNQLDNQHQDFSKDMLNIKIQNVNLQKGSNQQVSFRDWQLEALNSQRNKLIENDPNSSQIHDYLDSQRQSLDNYSNKLSKMGSQSSSQNSTSTNLSNIKLQITQQEKGQEQAGNILQPNNQLKIKRSPKADSQIYSDRSNFDYNIQSQLKNPLQIQQSQKSLLKDQVAKQPNLQNRGNLDQENKVNEQDQNDNSMDQNAIQNNTISSNFSLQYNQPLLKRFQSNQIGFKKYDQDNFWFSKGQSQDEAAPSGSGNQQDVIGKLSQMENQIKQLLKEVNQKDNQIVYERNLREKFKDLEKQVERQLKEATKENKSLRLEVNRIETINNRLQGYLLDTLPSEELKQLVELLRLAINRVQNSIRLKNLQDQDSQKQQLKINIPTQSNLPNMPLIATCR